MQGMSSLASLFPPSQPSLPPVLQTRRASVPVMYTPLLREMQMLSFLETVTGNDRSKCPFPPLFCPRRLLLILQYQQVCG